MISYIIHPSDIPIECEPEEIPVDDFGTRVCGGLLFRSQSSLVEGSRVRLRIPFTQPQFEATCHVHGCTQDATDQFLVRVHFLREEDLYRIRVVEQACHIEHYKREMLEKEGRSLSGNEAAYEWINKYAQQFPRPATQ